MIVKLAPNRRDGRSSFAALGGYITEGIEQSGDRAIRSSWDDLTQYITKQSVLDALGDDVEKTIAVEAGNVASLATAPAEMMAVASKCTRDTNPVMHMILSWPEGEKPEPQAIFRAGRHILRELGLLEHQYIVAIHDNTENRHAHIEVNRIHPLTYRPARLPWMLKTMHRAAREAEIEHGWRHDNGLYEVIEVDGRKIVVEAAARGESDRAETFGGNRAETWSGEVSFEAWCKDAPAAALRKALADPGTKDWQALHSTLANFGLELRESGGGGLRVYDVGPQDDEHATPRQKAASVSASKAFRFLKRAEVEENLGQFRAHDPAKAAAAPATAFKRDPQKRLESKLLRQAARATVHRKFEPERAAALAQRTVALGVLKEVFAASDADRNERRASTYRDLREQVRVDPKLDRTQKQQAYMAAKLRHEQQRAVDRLQAQQERADRRALLAPVPTWRQWVEAEAQKGDDSAIAALRGLIYQDGRDAKRTATAEPDTIGPVGTITPAGKARKVDPYTRALSQLTWRVSSHGVVTYRFNEGPVAFVDAGAKLRFDGAIVSDDALRVALKYAADKWRGDIRLNGGDQVFRQRVARLASDMRIELQNPELRRLQLQQLATHRAAAPLPYGHPISATQQATLFARKLLSFPVFRKDLPNAQNQDAARIRNPFRKPGFGASANAFDDPRGSAPKTLDGLRSLSSIPVVRLGSGPEVLLPDHARGDVRQRQPLGADALRRPGDARRMTLAAVDAAPRGAHTGAIAARDAHHVYQQTPKGMVRHPTRPGVAWPADGTVVTVRYANGTVSTVRSAGERGTRR